MNKASWWSQSNTHNWNGSYFSLSITSLPFSACSHLPHHYLFHVLAFFTYPYTDPTCFVKFSSLLVFSLR